MLHFRGSHQPAPPKTEGKSTARAAGCSIVASLWASRAVQALVLVALGAAIGAAAAARTPRVLQPRWLGRVDAFTAALRGHIFVDIAKHDKWNHPRAPPEQRATVAGPGSTVAYTAAVREWLGGVLANTSAFGPVRSMADLSCSELEWQTRIPGWSTLDAFYGFDIVASVVDRARERAAAARGLAERPRLHFEVSDMVSSSDPLPAVDLVLLRDTLMHLPLTDALRVLERIDASGSRWLATTTFDSGVDNVFIAPGSWFAVNLLRAPFLLAPPVSSVLEGHPGVDRYGEKLLALWRLPLLASPAPAPMATTV